MDILTDIYSLKQLLSTYKSKGKSIGFVPTMGALHDGHLYLVNLAQKDCDIVVCSIYINPTQFNDSNDLENYPVTIEQDIKLLKTQKCDILFMPSHDEMYPEGLKTNNFELNNIDKVLEGSKRPGHFDGVCTIVHRLFSIVEADYAYFGEKDFQQLAIIKQVVKNLSLPIKIKSGETVRENDGLAKSSRNTLLTKEERQIAPLIYKSLMKAKLAYNKSSYEELKKMIIDDINNAKGMELDYVEIVNPSSFNPLKNKTENDQAIALIAVFLGNIRLIDNLSLND